MPQPLPVPQRITIPPSAIVPLKSICIPLHLFPILKDGKTKGYKVGIVVQATDQNNRSTAPQMFEFDTGGQGFWLSPQSGIPTPALGDCTLTIQYTSGIEYSAQPQTLKLAFTEAEPLLVASATVGVIGQIRDTNPKKKGPINFPIYGHFFGDFGATPQAFVQANQTETSANSLLTVLAQLPPPFNNGFVVDVGPYPGSEGGSAAASPRLIVGLTKPLRDLFPKTIAMTKGATYSSPSGEQFKTYAENVIQGDLIVAPDPASDGSAANDIGVVFDTGAPGAVIHAGTNVPATCAPADGQWLQLTPDVAQPDFSLLSLTVGKTAGVDQVQSSTANVLNIAEGYINTGITAFFQSPILFDLERGLIGFPAPGVLS